MKGHFIETLVYSTSVVETKLYLGLEVRMYKEASTDHIQRTDRGMM